MQSNGEFMTIDEAIEHCNEVIRTTDCNECGQQHFQLIKWLEELIFYREHFREFIEQYNDKLDALYGNAWKGDNNAE